MKPYNFSHAEQLIGKTVKFKKHNTLALITEVGEVEVVAGNERYYFNDLLNDFTFLDGSPCGVEEEFNLSFIEVLQIAQNDDRFVSENTKYEFRFSEEKGLTFSSNNPILLVSNILKDKYKKL